MPGLEKVLLWTTIIKLLESVELSCASSRYKGPKKNHLFCESIGVFSDLAGFGPAVGCFAKTTELSPTSVSPWNPWLLLSFCHRCQGSRPHHPHHHLHHSQGPHRPHHCHLARLTLVLSCAMNFKNYPHDEQLCNLKIESSKFWQRNSRWIMHLLWFIIINRK